VVSLLMAMPRPGGGSGGSDSDDSGARGLLGYEEYLHARVDDPQPPPPPLYGTFGHKRTSSMSANLGEDLEKGALMLAEDDPAFSASPASAPSGVAIRRQFIATVGKCKDLKCA